MINVMGENAPHAGYKKLFPENTLYSDQQPVSNWYPYQPLYSNRLSMDRNNFIHFDFSADFLFAQNPFFGR